MEREDEEKKRMGEDGEGAFYTPKNQVVCPSVCANQHSRLTRKIFSPRALKE